MNNKNLHKAKMQRKDCFYTLMQDVVSGISPFAKNLKGKVVYCNCDTADSNFVKYLNAQFNNFKLKALVATSYKEKGKGQLFVRDKKHTFSSSLKGNGDFLSDECVKYLKKADVVITNPPFSKMDDFVDLIMTHNKDMLILCQQTVLSHKRISKYVRDNKLVFAPTIIKGGTWFEIPNDYEAYAKQQKTRAGKKYVVFSGIKWLTTFPCKTHELKEKHYNPKEYKCYDNYPNVINIDRIEDIPTDYMGVMGVPLTYVAYHDPTKYKFVGWRKGLDNKDLKVDGCNKFCRYLIQKVA